MAETPAPASAPEEAAPPAVAVTPAPAKIQCPFVPLGTDIWTTSNGKGRSFLMRSSAGFVVINAINLVGHPEIAQSVQDIVSGAGSTLAFITTVSGGHHLYIPQWATQFPEAQIILPGKRFPRIPSGKRLVDVHKAMLVPEGPPLPTVSEIEFVNLEGAWFFGEKPWADWAPADEFFALHKPSGVLISGDGVMFYSAADPPPAVAQRVMGLAPGEIGLFKFMHVYTEEGREKAAQALERVIALLPQTKQLLHIHAGGGVEKNTVTDIAHVRRSLEKCVVELRQIPSDDLYSLDAMGALVESPAASRNRRRRRLVAGLAVVGLALWLMGLLE